MFSVIHETSRHGFDAGVELVVRRAAALDEQARRRYFGASAMVGTEPDDLFVSLALRERRAVEQSSTASTSVSRRSTAAALARLARRPWNTMNAARFVRVVHHGVVRRLRSRTRACPPLPIISRLMISIGSDTG